MMNPRASMPANLVDLAARPGLHQFVAARRNERASPKSCVMSREHDAGLGIVGMVRMEALRSCSNWG